MVKGTTNPDWTAPPAKNIRPHYKFDIHVSRDQVYTNCNIEVELFDSDAKGNLTDYLGHVRLAGESLRELIEDSEHSPHTMELLRSRKKTDMENKHVRGTIEVVATLKEMGAVASSKSNKSMRRSSFMAVGDLSRPQTIMDSLIEASNEESQVDSAINLQDMEDILIDPCKIFFLYLVDLHLDVPTNVLPSNINLNTKDTSVILEIYANGVELKAINVPYVNKSTHLFSIEEHVEVSFPSLHPSAMCNVSVHVYISKPKYLHKKLSTITLTGLFLKDFLHRALDCQKASASGITAAPVLQCNMYSLTNQSKIGCIKFSNTLQPAAGSSFELLIRSCRNLPKADLFGKR
ncbi:hypothetical protein EON65_27250 [archaeon]|nr:MAG: hypothetical protein EON65_27250 [archaeon]